MTFRHRLRCLIILAIGLMPLLWNHRAFGAAAPGKIILGYAAPGARALPFWVAQDLGLFNKYGVDVEPVFYAVHRYSSPDWHLEIFTSAAPAVARPWQPSRAARI